MDLGKGYYSQNTPEIVELSKLSQKADLIEIDLHRPNMQPINNIICNLVYSGSKENVKMTMIDGKILYSDHEFHINEDINKIYEECQIATWRSPHGRKL